MTQGFGASAVALLLAALCLLAPARAAQADTLDLAFMPPVVEPQDLCIPGSDPVAGADLATGLGEEALSDVLRLRYLQRDIRNLQAADPDRWFDFIGALIDWRETLEPAFAGSPAILARIALYLDAGRLAELQAAGLIDQLRTSGITLTNAGRMELAQYYLNGIGVAPDPDYARGLIRDAAYGGNADALMALARMALQGNPVPGWEVPLDLTVTLAFGGMLGQMNADVCGRAERIAQEYLNGDVVTHNPAIAYAWYKFAADLGGGRAPHGGLSSFIWMPMRWSRTTPRCCAIWRWRWRAASRWMMHRPPGSDQRALWRRRHCAGSSGIISAPIPGAAARRCRPIFSLPSIWTPKRPMKKAPICNICAN